MTPRDLAPAAWLRLSPLLDELLDLSGEAARSARLADIGRDDPALAADLAVLLGRLAPVAEAAFLDAPALPPPAGLAGQTVGAYQLVRELGQGGMGSVWLAQRADGRYQGQVAIKFMRAGLLGGGGAGLAERFLREGQLLALLDHPHIARLLDAGVRQPQGQPYLVLDYVDGVPIDTWCDQQALGTTDRVRLMLRVLAAVGHAHGRNVLHRDLKPSNILVASDGQPKLLDFGIGKLLADAAAAQHDVEGQARAAQAVGAVGPGPQSDLTQAAGQAYTARYAAPEQLQAQAVTPATDVYALGVLLYGLLGGGHPTDPAGAPPVDRLRAVVDQVPRKLSDAVLRQGGPDAARRARVLRGDVDTIVAQALKKNPNERYADAGALADDLRRWLDHEPVAARPDGLAYHLGRFVRRHVRVVVAAGSAGALALGGGAGLALWQAHQAQAARAQAESLVEFMLGDLKDKLSALGRSDLLQAVGQRALAYYSAADLAALDDSSLARHARALRVVAETARLRMDSAQAQRGFDQASATTAQLLARAPDSIPRLQDHAESLGKLQEMAVARGDSGAALQFNQQAASLLHRAAVLEPGQPALRLKALASDQAVAYSLARAGRAEEALQLLAQARQAAGGLPASLPELAREQADNQLTTGLALVALGRYPQAVLAFQACLTLMDRSPTLQTDVWQRQQRAVVQRSIGRALLNQGQLGAAEQVARQLLAQREAEAALAGGQPNDAVRVSEINNDRLLLIETLWHGGQLDEARRVLAQAEASAAQASGVDPGHVEWHLRTRGALLALRLRLLGDLPAPGSADAQALQGLLGQVDQLARQGHALQGLALLAALDLGLALGDLQARAGQADAAQQQWQAVLQRALPAAQQGFPPAMQQLAQAQLRLGQAAQARTWAERLLATDYRHPDMASLQQQLARAGAATAGTSAATSAGTTASTTTTAAATTRP